MSVLRALVPAALIAVMLPACVVEEHTEARPVPRCRGASWVEGHYGPRGAWHAGHWRCPGVVEVVEID
jgi:hypothetical protein